MRDRFIRPGDCARRCCGPVLLLLLAAGCSSKGTVTGKITYQGKPLPAGWVTFMPEQGGGAFTSDIHDGEYKVTKVPPGPAKIAVDTPSESGPPSQFIMKMQLPAEVQPKGAPGQSPEEFGKLSNAPKPVPIPKKYRDPSTSGLSYTVTSGSQVHDIDLAAK